jgi:hypothetical protein
MKSERTKLILALIDTLINQYLVTDVDSIESGILLDLINSLHENANKI